MRFLVLTLAVFAALLLPGVASARPVYIDVNGNATGRGSIDGISVPLASFRRVVQLTYRDGSYVLRCRGPVEVTVRAFTPGPWHRPTRHPVPFETGRVACSRRAWRTAVVLSDVPAADPITVSEAKR